jgi:hypothetical protein
MMNGEPVTAFRPESPASQAMVAVWQNLLTVLVIQPIPST